MSKYRPRGLGMDRDLEKKIAEKYSYDDENEVAEWITAVLSEEPKSEYFKYLEGEGPEAFQAWLKDGSILCELMNRLTGRKTCKINKTANIKLAAMKQGKERENIGVFLEAAEKYGIKKQDLFQTVSLYEGTNLPLVQTALFKLGSEAMAKNFNGPVIGVKIAEKNVREFDNATLNEGKNIIGLQMGTNQVASQQGMTPYGLGRQLVSSPHCNGR